MSQTSPIMPAQPPTQPQSWLAKYWKLLLGLLATVVVLGIAAVFGILMLVMSSLKGSEVAKAAMARTRSNPALVQHLGTPIEEGWYASGSINFSDGSGNADLTLPISGPKGKGTLYVTAQKSAGVWTYSLMQAALEGSGERIDLLANPANAPSSAVATAPPVSSPPAEAGAATSTPAAASSQPAQPIPPPTGITSGQYSDDPDLRCDLLEVKRVSGGALTIRWRIVNTASQSKSIHYDFSWSEVYYIDPAEKKKYGFLTDAEGNKILDIFYGDLPAGQQRGNWAKFPAPPSTSNKISVNIPKFPPFEDVPVSQ